MIISICSNCGQDLGIKESPVIEIKFSHSVCKKCIRILYPEFALKGY